MAFFNAQNINSLLIQPLIDIILPKSRTYDGFRPHHLVLYSFALGLLKSTSVYRRISSSIVNLLSEAAEIAIPLVYTNLIPDSLIRFGIRMQLRDHLLLLDQASAEADHSKKMSIVAELKKMPIAIATSEANDQHYEVPAAFYDLSLGPRKKYSSGLWPNRSTTFEESEVAMLDLYCERAGLVDGMSVVDLGCGWGSLSLHVLECFPNCKITGISNSNSQREYILKTAKERGLKVDNINIVTCNVADDKGALDVVRNNDRVMTIEMFEHMKNYSNLMSKVHSFLKPGGKLFVHIFTHKTYAYHFEDGWMADNFFTGGTMPSDDLLLYFGENFSCQNHWRVNGTNYEKTSNGWLAYLDTNWKNGKLAPVLAEAYGKGKENEWYWNWRLFFLACAELWGYDGGEEWIVSHYLFERR